jgi:uncharacterized Fe-S radical SAM superfamily protein PflX
VKKLRRLHQCEKCPWRKDVDPRQIPNGYCETKHKALAATIAKDGNLDKVNAPDILVMACHEMHTAHCVGWLANQLGPGNNIPLRLMMRNVEGVGDIKLVGDQHERFEDTLP